MRVLEALASAIAAEGNIRINGDVELPVSWEIAQALEMTG